VWKQVVAVIVWWWWSGSHHCGGWAGQRRVRKGVVKGSVVVMLQGGHSLQICVRECIGWVMV
jgi:hypothetical protein